MWYAHTKEGRPTADWEPLEKHLQDVANLAAGFAEAFESPTWGRLAGLWHDLGKYSERFQAYLRSSADPDSGEQEQSPGKVDHSTFGARYAAKTLGPHAGQLLAFCIAGHHAGLPNATPSDASEQRSSLSYRLNDASYSIPPVNVPRGIGDSVSLTLPFKPVAKNLGFQVAFFTRLLFSALVDADRLATEEFCDPQQSAERQQSKPSLIDLKAALTEHLANKQRAAPQTPVNRIRAKVLADCLAAAANPPGFFSLNVPTGGGKTLSSLAFALHHATARQLRRVIVAIPFTSIIDQTADVFRAALEPLAERGLIEHHSNIEPRKNTRANQLATENWDAPLIVTTNVQLYESLFASRTRPCRKLHRLARSVIVLDEAQTLPVEFLEPTLSALKQLVECYGCTVLLCTATQPALERREGFEIGLTDVRRCIRDEEKLFADLKRVEVSRIGKCDDEALADRLSGESSVLCIVNTRPQAAHLYDALVDRCGDADCFHLSTFMCAEHRRRILGTIRARLKRNEPCRLVSTQLIEAGVDVDFSVVYRAPAGFDSIAQAAGRCNREGRLSAGRVYLFETESLPPPGLQRHAAQAAAELADRFSDPLAPAAVEAYFRLYYWSQKHQWDKHRVLDAFHMDSRQREIFFQFRDAANRYKIIRDEQVPILVPYNDHARQIRDRLLAGDNADVFLLRSCQRYLVSVPEQLLENLVDSQNVVEHESGLWLLMNEAAYSTTKGLSPGSPGFDPELLVV